MYLCNDAHIKNNQKKVRFFNNISDFELTIDKLTRYILRFIINDRRKLILKYLLRPTGNIHIKHFLISLNHDFMQEYYFGE